MSSYTIPVLLIGGVVGMIVLMSSGTANAAPAPGPAPGPGPQPGPAPGPAPGPNVPTIPTGTFPPGVPTAIVTASAAFLREGVSRTSRALGLMPKGTRVALAAGPPPPGGEGWQRIVTINDKEGYVSADLIAPEGGAPPAVAGRYRPRYPWR